MFHEQVRSLNLANAVSIAVYDMMRRRGLFETPAAFEEKE
jgi:tRNA(Leu) C34 or U34 (ribose-2'-O)-methylase TrmL